MKIFSIDEFLKFENPDPGSRYRREILTKEQAENMGALFGLLAPGSQTPYHFHKSRESVLIGISGEATEVVEGKEIPFKTNDIVFIGPGEKHATVNRTDREFRYIEFFTHPPVDFDYIEVK